MSDMDNNGVPVPPSTAGVHSAGEEPAAEQAAVATQAATAQPAAAQPAAIQAAGEKTAGKGGVLDSLARKVADLAHRSRARKGSYMAKSPWIIHYDAASCNGCDIELLASLTPLYDVERLGVVNTGNPRHADILMVTGSVNEQAAPVIRQIYDQMVEPKVVVACGICACSGGVFKTCYNTMGGVDQLLPVDVYVPGCAVRPQALIDGVVKAVEILGLKRAAMDAGLSVPTAPVRAGAEEARVLHTDDDPQGTALPSPEDRADAERAS